MAACGWRRGLSPTDPCVTSHSTSVLCQLSLPVRTVWVWLDMYDSSHFSAVPAMPMLRIWPINNEWSTVSNAALVSSSTVSTPFFLSAELRWSFWICTTAVSVLWSSLYALRKMSNKVLLSRCWWSCTAIWCCSNFDWSNRQIWYWLVIVHQVWIQFWFL